ncbi:MAG: glycosyltransferase family 9 protein [Mailhella sp.]|nr:glycosyltransferase family 9 protein [Mailhella sp.]
MMRIAVWNTAFLGDSVLTLPLIRVLKAAYPEAEIDFYVRGGLASLYEAQPEIARVFSCDKRGKEKGLSAMLRQGREIRRRGYDIWVGAHLSLRSSCMAWASGAKVRVGYSEATLSSFAYTKRTSRRFRELAEIERLLELAKALGVPQGLLGDRELCWPELRLPQSAHEDAAALLACLPEGPTIGLHPGSVWPTKRWTPEGFAAILRRALDSGVNAVLLAGPGEVETAAEVRRLAGLGCEDGSCSEPDNFLDLSGRTSLATLGAVLARLDGYVTNDSGPMHMAWAQHAPVTAMFGPTVLSLGFAPRGEASTVMQTDEPCRPCGLHGHKVCPQGHFRCMKNIDPEDVWRDIERKLPARKS